MEKYVAHCPPDVIYQHPEEFEILYRQTSGDDIDVILEAYVFEVW